MLLTQAVAEGFVWFPPRVEEAHLAETLCWMNRMNSKYREIDLTRKSAGDARIWQFTGDQ